MPNPADPSEHPLPLPLPELAQTPTKEEAKRGGVSAEEVAKICMQVNTKATEALMAQLAPLVQYVAVSMQADQVKQQAAALEAKAQEDARLVAATEAAEAKHAAEAAAKAKLQAEQAEEQARLRALLPERDVQMEADKRLKGGTERMGPRLDAINRLLRQQGSITEQDFARLSTLLVEGQQVSNLSPVSRWGVEQAGQADRPAAGLFAKLQANGLAPLPAGKAAEVAVQSVFKATAEKESKKSTEVKSWKEVWVFVRKLKMLTPQMLADDPASFMQMWWHESSVKFVNNEYGWPVAADYHARVMKKWSDGFLDVPSCVDSEEFRRGDVEGALLRDSFLLTLYSNKGAKVAEAAGIKAGSGGSKGSKARADPKDTWCDHHKLYFPAEEKHWWDAARKTGTCRGAGGK